MVSILITALLGLCVLAIAVVEGRKKNRRGEDEVAIRDHAHDEHCREIHQEMSLRSNPAGDDGGGEVETTVDELLARVRAMVPPAMAAAGAAEGFPGRWKAIAAKMDKLPACLSDLSSHPCFARNTLCRELLQSVAATLAEAAELAALCRAPPRAGKLQTQSAVDALAGKLDLNLRDCSLLVKTGVLSDAFMPAPAPPSPTAADVRELLARLQIGHTEAKSRAVDGLLEAISKDEKSVLSVLGRANVAALVQLLTSPAAKVREKAATVICHLAESGNCETLLVSEGVLPPLIRLAESGTLLGREKAVVTLHRLSMSPVTARAIAGHGGARPLIEICQTGDSISQSAAAGALKNISTVPESQQTLADEGIIRVMVSLLDCGTVLGSKEHAADCLRNLTSTSDSFRRAVVSDGGLRSLLVYLDAPLPRESAVTALGNLVGDVSPDSLVSLGVLPRLAHVLRVGSLGAQQAAASAIWKISTISSSVDMKRVVGEHGCVPLLVRMLDAKSNSAREAAAQAVASLVGYGPNAREVREGVPCLVQLLDPSAANTAKKYAVACLLSLAAVKRCRKLMVSHGAIGYLKKLSDMDVAGARKLLQRLEERGKLRSLFSTRD
uniref:DUF7032 domain-containing protein n=1 Tax=Leersia perrieri TaxID=77586 RepID=A0A0D9VNP5_9ORYZ